MPFEAISPYKRLIKALGKMRLDHSIIEPYRKTSFYGSHLFIARIRPSQKVFEGIDPSVAGSINLERYVAMTSDGRIFISGVGYPKNYMQTVEEWRKAVKGLNERFKKLKTELIKRGAKKERDTNRAKEIVTELPAKLRELGVDVTLESTFGHYGPQYIIKLATVGAINRVPDQELQLAKQIGGHGYNSDHLLTIRATRRGGMSYTPFNPYNKNGPAYVTHYFEVLKNKAKDCERGIANPVDLFGFTSPTPPSLGGRGSRYFSMTQLSQLIVFSRLYGLDLDWMNEVLLPIQKLQLQQIRPANRRARTYKQDYITDYGKVIIKGAPWGTAVPNMRSQRFLPYGGLYKTPQIVFKLADIDKTFTVQAPPDKAYKSEGEVKQDIERTLEQEFVKWESFERLVLEAKFKETLATHFTSEITAIANEYGLEFDPDVRRRGNSVHLGRLCYGNHSVPVMHSGRFFEIGPTYVTSTKQFRKAVRDWKNSIEGKKQPKTKFKPKKKSRRRYREPKAPPTKLWDKPGKPFPHSVYHSEYEVPGQRSVPRASGKPFTLFIHYDENKFPESIFSGMNLHAKILPELKEGFLGWIGGYIDTDTSCMYVTEIQSDLMQRTWDMLDEFTSKYRAKQELKAAATKLKELRRDLARLPQKTWAPASAKFDLIQQIQSVSETIPRIKERITRVPRLSEYSGHKSKLENIFKRWIDVFYGEVQDFARKNNISRLRILPTSRVYSSGAPKTEDTIYYRAYDAIAEKLGGKKANYDTPPYGSGEWWEIPLNKSESLDKRLSTITEAAGGAAFANVYHRLPNEAVLNSVMRSTLLPSIAGAQGPGIYGSLSPDDHRGFGPIVLRLKVNLADKFIIMNNREMAEKVYGDNLTVEEQFQFYKIDVGRDRDDWPPIRSTGSRGHIVLPTEQPSHFKAWSEINGIVTGKVVVIYRPIVARLMDITVEEPEIQKKLGYSKRKVFKSVKAG